MSKEIAANILDIWFGFAKEITELFPEDAKRQLEQFEQDYAFYMMTLKSVPEEDLYPCAIPIAEYMKACILSVWGAPLSDGDRLWVLKQNVRAYLQETF